MLLSIEYLLRNDRAFDVLEVPFSLFLENEKLDKVIMTVHRRYSFPGYVLREWQLYKCDSRDRLPPAKERIVTDYRNEILDGFSPLAYEPCEIEDRPRIMIETSNTDYDLAQLHYYNNIDHRMKRTNWLWKSFNSIYMNTRGHDNEWQYQQRLPRKTWQHWSFWEKHLDFTTSVAPELAYYYRYNKVPPIEYSWETIPQVYSNFWAV